MAIISFFIGCIFSDIQKKIMFAVIDRIVFCE